MEALLFQTDSSEELQIIEKISIKLTRLSKYYFTPTIKLEKK